MKPARASGVHWFFSSISTRGTRRACRHLNFRCCGGPHLGRHYFCRPCDFVDSASEHDLVATKDAERRKESHSRGSRKYCACHTRHIPLFSSCARGPSNASTFHTCKDSLYRSFHGLITCPYTARSTFFHVVA